jgi:choline-sulfatase
MTGIQDALTLPAEVHGEARPNILMLFSDEHHWQYSGYAGHPVVRTPNLDRLAARGVNFTNAYCNSPLCSPSRQSFMAGLYAHRIGMWNNCCAMPENTVTWAHALSHAGYETLLLGKMHFNGYQKMYGFDRRPVLEGNDYDQQFHSWGVRTSHDWTWDYPVERSGGIKTLRAAGPDSETRQPVFRHDMRVTEGALEVLREKAADEGGQPWAMCVGHVLPHPPFRARPDLWEEYSGRGLHAENPWGEGLGECDSSLRAYLGLAGNDYSEEQIRRVREAYYGLVTEYDEHVGRILACLEETGQAENTIVLYFSDHGEMCGEHGIVGKVSLRESSVRVPLLASWPGHFPEGADVAAPVSLVDLYPTFLDIAGTRLPDVLPLDGRSLLPLLDGREPPSGAERSVFGEFEGEGWNHPRCFLREGEYKYVINHTSAPELYNLAEDYLELQNLAGRPECAELERRMRGQVLAFWDPEEIELEVLRTQARQKLARCRNVCADVGR